MTTNDTTAQPSDGQRVPQIISSIGRELDLSNRFRRQAYETLCDTVKKATPPDPAKVEAMLEHPEVLEALKEYFKADIEVDAKKLEIGLLEKKKKLAGDQVTVACEEYQGIDMSAAGGIDPIRGVVEKEDRDRVRRQRLEAIRATREVLAMSAEALATIAGEAGRDGAAKVAGKEVSPAFVVDLAELLRETGDKARKMIEQIMSDPKSAKQVAGDDDMPNAVRFLATVVHMMAKEVANDSQS